MKQKANILNIFGELSPPVRGRGLKLLFSWYENKNRTSPPVRGRGLKHPRILEIV